MPNPINFIFQNGIDQGAKSEYKFFNYPKHWQLHRVDNFFDLQLGKMSSAGARSGPNQLRYVKNNNVLWGEFDFSDLSQMSFDEKEQQKFSLKKGDLLVCEGGEIGRAAIWNDEIPGLLYQKAIHRLRSKSGKSSTIFMMHYLRYCAMTGILNSISTGTTILHLPEVQLAALILPFPQNDEQHEIVLFLSSAWNAIKLVTKRSELDSERHKLLVLEVFGA